jgi:hypothetical protein
MRKSGRNPDDQMALILKSLENKILKNPIHVSNIKKYKAISSPKDMPKFNEELQLEGYQLKR